MSTGTSITNYCETRKMFSWTFNNFAKISVDNLEVISAKGEKPMYYLPASPIEVIDEFSGEKFIANCNLHISSAKTYISVNILITPYPGKLTGFVELNKEKVACVRPLVNSTQKNHSTFNISCNIVKIPINTFTFYLNVAGFRSRAFTINPFFHSEKVGLATELLQMWKGDSSMEFTIKCPNKKEIKVIKPIMAARSDVFKAMFESNFRESEENFVEIKEFDSKIIEKMVEFCETDTIKEFKNFEDELFRIAHLYQIKQLMYFCVEKMAENMSVEKIGTYLQLAELYELQEFKEWCRKFAFRNGISF